MKISPQALAELEMIVREATEEKCRFLEKRLLIEIQKRIDTERKVADGN